MQPSHFPALYLVELMNPETGNIDEVDVCARLDVAIEKVYNWLDSFGELRKSVCVEVSYDDEGVLEGVGFFNDEQDMASCITTYQLDRDADVASISEIASACAGPKDLLQSALNRVFRN